MLADILQMCLIRIDAGASVDECLAAYPQQRAALEAPLHAAVRIRVLPRPALPVATRAALETRMLALAAQRRAAPSPATSPNGRTSLPPSDTLGPAALLAGLLRALGYRGPLARPWLRLASAIVALALALVLGAGALAAARAIVRAIQGPVSTPTNTLPAATPFTLDGPIEQIAPERWIVNGISVALDAQTTVNGTPRVGAVAHVRGQVQADATLLAHSMTVDAQQPTSTSAPIPTIPPPPKVVPTTIPVQPPPPPKVVPTTIPLQPPPPPKVVPTTIPLQPPPPNAEPAEAPKPDTPGKPHKPPKPPKPPKPHKPGKGEGGH